MKAVAIIREEDDDAEDPEDFAGGFVRPVVEAAPDMDVDRDEEHRRAVGVQVAQQPAEIHVAHDVLDGSETPMVASGV